MMLLSMEPLILARLREVMPRDVFVLSAADLAGITEGSQPTPAVYLLWGEFIVQAEGLLVYEKETWNVVLALRNVADVRQGISARSDAASLLATLKAALDGWLAVGAQEPLRYITPKVRSGYRDGYQYIALSFEHTINSMRTTC